VNDAPEEVPWSEEDTRKATCRANGIDPAFDGTYPHVGDVKRAGWTNPPVPGSTN
jgi:hypothetical protein